MAGRLKHGKHSTYTSGKCRCELCKKAHAVYARDYRARVKASGLQSFKGKHGTYYCYVTGQCRCPRCCRAMRLIKELAREKNHLR